MEYKKVLEILKSMANAKKVGDMARYGINPKNNLGISIYKLRLLANDIGENHQLALKLWDSGIREARLLACFVEDSQMVTSEQMDSWAKDFDSWDICDQACTSLFDLNPLAWKKVIEWADRKEEFVKRGAFSIIAGLAVHDKKAEDSKFESFFSIIKREAIDERNYVKKAVNWALRNIGKRNLKLNKMAIKTAKDIQEIDSKSARWIASDAIRELNSERVQNRLMKKNKYF
jgi:3-methyladenine DNA glycosylase AlkD